MSKDIIKPGIVLLIVTVIAAGLLGAVNIATKDIIAAEEAETKANSMKSVLPDAEEFDEEKQNDNKDYSIIKKYTKGVDESGNTVGYAVEVSTKGFSTGLNLMIGITTDGVIRGVAVLSHGETPGLGANAKEKWKDDDHIWVDQFAGKSGELSVTKGDSPADDEIQAITGATITSDAITNAVNTVSDFYNSVLSEGGDK